MCTVYDKNLTTYIENFRFLYLKKLYYGIRSISDLFVTNESKRCNPNLVFFYSDRLTSIKKVEMAGANDPSGLGWIDIHS
jgi:hypothetical protein